MKPRRITATDCIRDREESMRELDKQLQLRLNSFWSQWYDLFMKWLCATSGPWGLAGVEGCDTCGAMKFINQPCGKCAAKEQEGKVPCPMLGERHPTQCNLCKGSGYVDEL